MRVCAGLSGPLVLSLVLVLVRGWEADLELLDLVEEVSQNFYEFLHLDKDAAAADIKKAYRRLSLTLHPDKNKDENAETQFRQLVAIYEVLKDEDRRRRYDDILENGLPDWRQPVFYYRRVRKMSNAELGFLLFLILTVGHYAVIWSIYLEKQLDELLSRKKKEKKKKLSSRPAEELRYIGQDRSDRSHERPQWQDILPLKLSIWLYLALKNLPQTVQEVKRFYEDYRQTKQEAEAEQEVAPREKRPKVKKPKVEFPVYVPPETQQNYDQTTSIEDIEDQMDNWLQDAKAPKKKESGWTEDDLSLLSRLMVKFPGGTPGRWEKIAQELGRSVPAVTTKVKQMKDNVNQTSALVKLSDLKSPPLPVRSFPVDDIITQRVGGASEEEEEEEEEGEEEAALVLRRRKKKSSCTDGWEGKVRGRRQKDFDPAAAVEEQEEAELQENMAVWTQNQQKLLELALQQFPRGTTERWDRIAKVVPGKTKEDCVTRCKMLAELVKKRKQLKS